MTAPDTRRFPITLRALTVTAIEDLNPRMRRITLGGAQIGAFDAGGRVQPALQSLGPDDHVKLFFADPETGLLSLPRQGDGRLHWPEDPPAISREYTPRGFDPDSGRLVLDFVLHGHGVAGSWAAQARLGDVIHIGGPKASMLLPDAGHYLLLGDETAIPAIANWLEMLPAEARVDAHILSTEPAARIALRAPRAARIAWHTHDPQDTEALVRLAGTPGRDSFVWAAGERGAITALRAHLTALDHPRDLTDLSNYWTLGEAAKD